MKFTKSTYLITAILLSSASYQAVAQARDQDKDKNRDRVHQLEREHQVDRTMDRDQDRDRTREQDQTRDQDRDRIKEQDQTRDKDRFNDDMGGAIYGGELMTEQERSRFREQLKTATSEQERNEIRLQHQKTMELREQNKSQYQDGLGGIIYGSGLMTEQERSRYREQLKTATSEQQRNDIRLQHQKEMHLREQNNSN